MGDPWITLYSMDEVSNLCKLWLQGWDPKRCLVLFDVDMVLTQPTHWAAYRPNICRYKEIWDAWMGTVPVERKDLILSAVASTSQMLVEHNVLAFLQWLREEKVPHIAITALLTGALGTIDRLEIARYQMLRDLQISFEETFPEYPELLLKEIPLYWNRYPVFYKGILLTNGERGTHTKGTVLRAFLKKINKTFDAICCIDDKKKNLRDIQDVLGSSYPFLGIEYHGADQYASHVIEARAFEAYWREMARLWL